jgi:hypothetical protein
MNLRTSRRAALAMAAGLIASGISAGIAAPAAQAGTKAKWGCPGGAVCMYTTEGWWDDKPQHIYYSYGYHTLTNEFGQRVVFNNQYATSSGRAAAYTCTAKTASSCNLRIAMDDFEWVNITPINYIRLTASGG